MWFRSFPTWETNTTAKSGWISATTFTLVKTFTITSVLASGSAFIKVVSATLDPNQVDPINVESTPSPPETPPSTNPLTVSYLPRVLIAALLAFAAILIPASVFLYRSRHHQHIVSSSAQQRPSSPPSYNQQEEQV